MTAVASETLANRAAARRRVRGGLRSYCIDPQAAVFRDTRSIQKLLKFGKVVEAAA